MTEVVVVTRVAAPPEVVFGIALDMDDHSAALAASRETAVVRSGRRVLELGDVVDFRAFHFGLPWRLSARVVEMDRPRSFADEQVRGPFATLRHEHGFAPDGAGGTVMTDRLVFLAPLGPLGRVVAPVLAGHLRRLLVVRNAHLARTASAQEPGPPGTTSTLT